MSKSVVEKAIKLSGGVGALAKALGISPQAVHKWKTAGVPADRVVDLEEQSGLPREMLRPDLYRSKTGTPSDVASRRYG